MAANPTITELDSAQIIQRCYDGANDSLRMEIADQGGIALNFDPTTDTVSTYSGMISENAPITVLSTGQVIGPISCVGLSRFQLYAIANTTTSGTLAVRLDFNPD